MGWDLAVATIGGHWTDKIMFWQECRECGLVHRPMRAKNRGLCNTCELKRLANEAEVQEELFNEYGVDNEDFEYYG